MTLTQEVEVMDNEVNDTLAELERMQKDCERIAQTLDIIESALLAVKHINENNVKALELRYDNACRIFGIRVFDRKNMKN